MFSNCCVFRGGINIEAYTPTVNRGQDLSGLRRSWGYACRAIGIVDLAGLAADNTTEVSRIFTWTAVTNRLEKAGALGGDIQK
jgi:hypothetical protein